MEIQANFNYNYENVKKIFMSTDDFFVIVDGCALILEVIQNKHTNWTSNRGVYLHLIYGIERYLSMLLGLKKFIKIIFFTEVERLLRKSDADLFLAFELAIFHLKNMPQFKNNLIYCSLNDYEEEIQSERIAGFIGFSFRDLKLSNKTLESNLKVHLYTILALNLKIGVATFLTKNLWHDTNGAWGYIVEKGKGHLYSDQIHNFSYDYREDHSAYTQSDISRHGFYFEAVKNVDANVKNHFYLHLYLLETTPVIKRKIKDFPIEYLGDEALLTAVDTFKFGLAEQFYSINKSELAGLRQKKDTSDEVLKRLCDIFDGRLFFKTAFILKTHYNNVSSFESVLTNKDYYLGLLDNKSGPAKLIEFKNKIATVQANETVTISDSVELDSKLFKAYLENFKFVNSTLCGNLESNIKTTYFDENLEEFSYFVNKFEATSQWQNTKFAIYLENYSKSFEFTCKAQNIYMDLLNQVEKPQERSKNAKKAEQIIHENLLRKYQKSLDADKVIVSQYKSQTAKLVDPQRIEIFLNDLSLELKKCHTRDAKSELLNIYLDLLFKQISFTNEPKSRLVASFQYYKVAEAAARVFVEDKSLAKRIQKDFDKILTALGSNRNMLEYQLEDAQFVLHREHFGRPDKRVDDFVPDAWQIQLMDVIDARHSCIVVAPTSSGKTFASFYAFEKILREKDDSVIVYVAPSKALINQMLAAIYSKYKRVDPGKGKYLIGTFTRDTVKYLTNCRILLTVPECLEILFFNKAAYESVAVNIKYIVFDEFQAINDESRGKIWERVVLFCDCPFLALSATINNPAHLRNWLETAKNNRKTILIEYNQPSTEFVYNIYKR